MKNHLIYHQILKKKIIRENNIEYLKEHLNKTCFIAFIRKDNVISSCAYLNIMEKAANVAVKQASFQWNDLGTLGALYEITMKDFHENAVNTNGKIQLDESAQNLIICDDETEIRLEKIQKCAVIKSGKALLITTKW